MTDIFEESNTDSARRLVTVQKVSALEPIEGKDRIELARVMGWWCIVKKGEFKVGDLCVFHEPDTVVDVSRPCYAFLTDKAKVGKYRIRTMRMGGVLSQGLALPVSALTECSLNTDVLALGCKDDPSACGGSAGICEAHTFDEGDDVTQAMGCTKYEPAVTFAGHIKTCSGARRLWPGQAPAKTDEIRLQSCMGVLSEFAGVRAYAAIKLDGSSMTLINTEGYVQMCSRNFEIVMAEDEGGTFTETVKSLGLAEKLPHGYAVQGELVGPSVQKNRLGLTANGFFVFNVFTYVDENGEFFSNKKPRLLDYDKTVAFCKDHGFSMVPVFSEDFVFDANDPVKAVFETMKPLTYAGTKFPIEGFVIRPHQVTSSRFVSPWLSVKVINPEYEIQVK